MIAFILESTKSLKALQFVRIFVPLAPQQVSAEPQLATAPTIFRTSSDDKALQEAYKKLQVTHQIV